ncbi:hypothetical protein LP7551_02594 [Roseibium album]|nr:hypothetical protein LP7551_02594 [Roseibium album]
MTGFSNKARQFLGKIAAKGNRLNTGSIKEIPSLTRTDGPRWAEPEMDVLDESGQLEQPIETTGPVRRPFVAPFYLWGTLAVLMAGFAIGAVYWQLQQEKQKELAGSVPVYGDPLLSLDTSVRNVLLNPTPELAARLKRSFLGQPGELCAELNSLGLENYGWKKAPFQKERWQCASDLVSITTPSVDYGATTLFFLLRGPSEAKIDYLRLKLVVEDARQKQLGLESVWLVIDALAGRYGWTVPSSFRDAISNFQKLETVHRGVRLSVAPEDPELTDDPLADQRLNIILDFGEPDLIRPADSFKQAPPLESGWSVKVPGDQEAE